MTTTPAQPFKDPAMNPLTPRKIAQLRRIAEDAADNREKAVITANDLNDLLDHASKDNARPLTADDITDEMVQRVRDAARDEGLLIGSSVARRLLTAALTEPPRPEGAEKVEAALHQYWAGNINGDELANRIAEEMNR